VTYFAPEFALPVPPERHGGVVGVVKSEQHHGSPAEQDVRLAAFLAALRDQLEPSSPPTPSPALRRVFDGGLGAVEPLAAPAPPRRRSTGRRRLVAVGAAAILAIGGTGAAGALPGAAQDAFDRTAEAVGWSRAPRPVQVPPAGVVPDGPVDAVEAPSVEDPGKDQAPADGRTFAETTVVPDATDPGSPGVDDPASLSDDARRLGPAEAGTTVPQQTPAGQDRPVEPAAPDGSGAPPEGSEEHRPTTPDPEAGSARHSETPVDVITPDEPPPGNEPASARGLPN
jgi:hypothetical protein